MKEIWKTVPSAPKIEVSSWGRVRIKRYECVTGNHARFYEGKPTLGLLGDRRFRFMQKRKTYKVHRLVCEAFHGQPAPGQVAMHRDDNALNNRPENIKWGTQKENLNAKAFIEHCKRRTGEFSPATVGAANRAAGHGPLRFVSTRGRKINDLPPEGSFYALHDHNLVIVSQKEIEQHGSVAAAAALATPILRTEPREKKFKQLN